MSTCERCGRNKADPSTLPTDDTVCWVEFMKASGVRNVSEDIALCRDAEIATLRAARVADRNAYVLVADALAAKSDSPEQLAEIARGLHKEIATLRARVATLESSRDFYEAQWKVRGQYLEGVSAALGYGPGYEGLATHTALIVEENAELRARVEAMGAALAPFARMGEGHDGLPDDFALTNIAGEYLLLGHLRACTPHALPAAAERLRDLAMRLNYESVAAMMADEGRDPPMVVALANKLGECETDRTAAAEVIKAAETWRDAEDDKATGPTLCEAVDKYRAAKEHP